MEERARVRAARRVGASRYRDIGRPGKERIPRFRPRRHEQPLVSTGRQLEQTEADQRLDRAVHDAVVI